MNRKTYFAPETEALFYKTEGMLCYSGGIADMDVSSTIDGDVLFTE